MSRVNVRNRPVPHAISSSFTSSPVALVCVSSNHSLSGASAVRCMASCLPTKSVSVETSYTSADAFDSHPSVCQWNVLR